MTRRFAVRSLKGAQRTLQRRYAGGLRWTWNAGLAEILRRHEAGEQYPSYAAMCKQLTQWRNAPETAWLAGGPIHAQQQVLKRLDKAYRRFMKGEAGRPHFKSRGEEPSLRFPDPKQLEFDATNLRVKLPKLGWVRLRPNADVRGDDGAKRPRAIEGELRNVTLGREGTRLYCSIQIKVADVAPSTEMAPTLGLDMGAASFAATSEGALIEPLDALRKQEHRLARYQRVVARRKKGSKRRGKAKQRVAKLHARIAAQRNDWLHKLTTQLADRHPVIAIEDLKVAAMTASAKGTEDAPGRNVRAKAGLNRSILDQGWGEFRRQLEYKCTWRGGEVIAVPPAYTSRTCRKCKHESADNRKTQSVFACVACGHTEHADIHAAKNILAAGYAVWAERKRGSLLVEGPAQSGHPVNREPTEEAVDVT